uniref:Malate dehydrogenase n=13 Tax=Enterobacteriaceae TaxID=543 RepID=V9SJN5_ECOLX|nr:hypothetical protein [Escherichia coli]
MSNVNRRKPNMVEYSNSQILLAYSLDCTMTKKSLAERFDLLEQEYNSVMSTKYMGTSAFNHRRQEYIDSAKGNNWIARAKKLLEDSYGKESDYYKDFNDKKRIAWSSNYQSLVKHYKPIFDAAREDLAHSVTAQTMATEHAELDLIINILNKFPAFCRQLKKRYNDRTPLEINDEYDVQDLVHALLLLHFDDIRPEEGSPSFAGSSSRQDFLLKKEKIVIEVKKTRRFLGANKIGEELLIDMARYRAHPDCETLVCFVYDPEGWVTNPKGVIDDLEGKDADGKTRVVIAQF